MMEILVKGLIVQVSFNLEHNVSTLKMSKSLCGLGAIACLTRLASISDHGECH